MGFLFAAEEVEKGQAPNKPKQPNMIPYNTDPEGSDAPRHEGEILLIALREIYLEAGLSQEFAERSAIADLEQTFGSLCACAA